MLDPVFSHPLAHRGLHDAKVGIIENTRSAFEAAAVSGYGIECDLQPAKGGEPMVFHDRALDRLLGRPGEITGFTPRQLAKFRYVGAPEPVLSFAQLLELVAGRVPLMVEIKSEWRPDEDRFYARIARLAKAYKGPIALKSFDPAVMQRIRRLAPYIPRGIISGGYRGPGWWCDRLSLSDRFALRHLMAAAAVAPSFISYDIKALPAAAPMRLKRDFGVPLFAWTVRSPADLAKAARLGAVPIFEGLRP